MQIQEERYYSPEEYLELEVNSEEKHEYIDGKIILQASEIPNHNTVVGNFGTSLLMAFKRQPYQVFIFR